MYVPDTPGAKHQRDVTPGAKHHQRDVTPGAKHQRDASLGMLGFTYSYLAEAPTAAPTFEGSRNRKWRHEWS